MSLLHHLKRGERLFGLVVFIQMPRKIGDGEQDDRERDYEPMRRARVKKISHRVGQFLLGGTRRGESFSSRRDVLLPSDPGAMPQHVFSVSFP